MNSCNSYTKPIVTTNVFKVMHMKFNKHNYERYMTSQRNNMN